ncbi:MAG: DUF1295 domain-containing protein [Calditrichaeota bacterium]|nr:DUF1295 domain-containing protein [Calditrichota bacterium]MCB0304419.1 DUF1295 domain-containing protein [Calditrichota bacterium]MCB9086928.1 DUF1295 domain-containing protein [Calditrichia bacterium]
MSKIIATTTVTIQFLCAGYLVLSGPVLVRHPLGLAVQIGGILLGLWAIAAMQIGNFNITPTVRQDARMVTAGPYRYIRHPMYAALLLATFPLALAPFTVLRLLGWVTLLVTLLVKLSYEEKWLCDKFEAYGEYQAVSKRLIPFVF